MVENIAGSYLDILSWWAIAYLRKYIFLEDYNTFLCSRTFVLFESCNFAIVKINRYHFPCIS